MSGIIGLRESRGSGLINGGQVSALDTTGTPQFTAVKTAGIKSSSGVASFDIAAGTGDMSFGIGNTDVKVKLPVASGIYKGASDTAVLTESSGTVTLDNVTLGGSVGGSVALPAGTVLQVVSTNKDTVVSQLSSEVTGGTWGDISGMTVAITPATNGNKVLVNVSMALSTAGSSYHILVRLLRGATVINGGVEAGDREAAFGKVYQHAADVDNISMTYLDTPPAGASTYKVQWQGETGTTIFLNAAGTDDDREDFGRYASNITVMEIKV